MPEAQNLGGVSIVPELSVRRGREAVAMAGSWAASRIRSATTGRSASR
jgi:hypothetical protein